MYFGNETRFINHSCTPNAKSRETPIFNGKDSLFGVIMVFAKKKIKRGEEITMNYFWQGQEQMEKDLQCICYPGCDKILLKAIKGNQG